LEELGAQVLGAPIAVGCNSNSEYYVVLSQDHPEMAYAEMDSMLSMLEASIVHIEPGLAIVRMGCSAALRIPRELAYVKEIGAVLYSEPLGEGTSPYMWIRSLRGSYKLCSSRAAIKIYSLGRRRFAADYKLLVEEVMRLGLEETQRAPQRGMDRMPNPGCLGSLSIVVGSVAVIGRPIAARIKMSPERSSNAYMGKEDLAFMAIMYRNLRGGGRVFDLFCGYGYILRETCEKASPETIIGGEIDRGKALASKEVIGSGCYSEVVLGDALRPPFRGGCVDALISDLPYGRRSRAHSSEALEMPLKFFEVSSTLLSAGGLIIASLSLDQFRHIASALMKSKNYRILYLCTQYVHGSLSRVYTILGRVEKGSRS